MKQTDQPPIACELSAEEQQRYANAYKSGLFSHVEEVRAQRDGYSFRFAWRPERIRELCEFIELDSSCCSFLDHSVEVPRGKQLIWLHITGPRDAAALLQQEVEQLLPQHLKLPTSPVGSSPAIRRRRWAGTGLSGIGLAAGLCCIAPLVGLSSIAVGSAWLIDGLLALLIVLGLAAIAWWKYARRRAASGASCC